MVALELHGNRSVRNVSSLPRRRRETGPLIGANLDPSQLVWMGADPLVAAEAPRGAIHHVHARDTMLDAPVQAVADLPETGGPMDIPARA